MENIVYTLFIKLKKEFESVCITDKSVKLLYYFTEHIL